MIRVARSIVVSVVLIFNPARAQDTGDPQAGLSLAREECASCHAVTDSQLRSPNQSAPSFKRIADVPGMTPLALSVLLRTTHKSMPNIMLEPTELRDVVAYITSLQGHP
jgi:mono/diheme cytochrome c family protein